MCRRPAGSQGSAVLREGIGTQCFGEGYRQARSGSEIEHQTDSNWTHCTAQRMQRPYTDAARESDRRGLRPIAPPLPASINVKQMVRAGQAQPPRTRGGLWPGCVNYDMNLTVPNCTTCQKNMRCAIRAPRKMSPERPAMQGKQAAERIQTSVGERGCQL